jgi:sugar phosphate isomerase/epimerase
MFLAGRVQMVSDVPYAEGIKKLLDIGFEGIEVNNVDRSFTFREEFLLDDTINSIKLALSDDRVKGFSIGSHMDYVNDDICFQNVVKSMDVANKLGTDIVIINGAKKMGIDNEWDLMLNRTKELAQEAEKRHIKLAKEFEPKYICGSTANLLKVFEFVKSDALFANLDIGHVFLCDEKPIEIISRLGDRVAHCHIENMKTGIHNHLPFYEGDMDLPSYIQALKNLNFDGQMSFDYYNDGYMDVAKECIEYFYNMI